MRFDASPDSAPALGLHGGLWPPASYPLSYTPLGTITNPERKRLLGARSGPAAGGLSSADDVRWQRSWHHRVSAGLCP